MEGIIYIAEINEIEDKHAIKSNVNSWNVSKIYKFQFWIKLMKGKEKNQKWGKEHC